MSLEKYKQKRTLSKTPEPAGGKPTSNTLSFVIQKHQASHLHYDFRLELKGTLKSWAVPKGPSTDPSVTRLAMLVEDHPFDYKNFEGIIPEGNYGAGTVIIWDQGSYEPAEKIRGKKEQEQILLKQFYTGKMEIILHGKKVKGLYTLTKNSSRGENSWLLVKAKDKHASKSDISKKDKSVVSGQTIETLSGNPSAREWQSNRQATKTRSTSATRIRIPEGSKKASMPSRISPMLCTLTKQPVNNEDYLYEVKWDGYRIISYVSNAMVKMDSRSGLDYTSKYPPIVAALKKLKHKLVVDGEVVVLNNQGTPDFDALQTYNGHNTPIYYYLFDLVWFDGYDLKNVPLTERKKLLRDLIEGDEVLRYSESFDDGEALYEQSKKMELEGIVAKKKNSFYKEGERGVDWLKTPARKRQEFVIGGWAESERGRSFRSLLFGAYNKGKLEWIGRSGGGYKDKEMPGILKQLKKLEIKKSPFENKVLDTKGAIIHWVKPQLVANFEFATWTKSGRIRKPATFLGFRNDKRPEQVVRELVKNPEEVESTKEKTETTRQKRTTKSSPLYLNADSNWIEVDREQKNAEWSELEMENCNIKVHNLDRELWKGIPKARLILYYSEMADTILPYIKDHPQSLVLKLGPAGSKRYFIKDMENRQPECATIFSDKRRGKKEGKRNQIDYLVCNNKETLLYMIDLGCVDINTWASRIQNIEYPQYIWLDLDPTIPEITHAEKLKKAEDVGFSKAVRVAKASKKILDKYKLTGFVKTSGKTGLHIYVPCSSMTFAQTRAAAENLAQKINVLVPDISTVNESINQRGDNVYIDAGQNDYADTLAAPYCVRPYHQPLVSTPLDWAELNFKLDRYDFNLETIQARLKKKGDLFKGVLDKKVISKNDMALKKLI